MALRSASSRLPAAQVNLNQDPLFSECLVYYVNDGVTLLGSDPHGDIQLSGPDMRPRHAVLTFSPGPPTSPGGTADDDMGSGGLIHLCPVDGAVTYLNGRLISQPPVPVVTAESPTSSARPSATSQSRTVPVLLSHNARVVFGRHHVFRFEQPLAATRSLPEDMQQRRADRKADRRTVNGELVVACDDESVGSSTSSGAGGLLPVVDDAVLDWDFTLRELLINSPDAPLVNPDGLRGSSHRSSSRR